MLTVIKRNLKTLSLPNFTQVVYDQYDVLHNFGMTSYFNEQKFAILGYGPQGRAQALNLRDQGFNVILGLRKDGSTIKLAEEDGWTTNIMSINDAIHSGTFIMNLLSDAGQIETWPFLKKELNENKEKTLYFSHGFASFKKHTNIDFPKFTPTILVAPKCSGNTVRNNFIDKKGFAASYAISDTYVNSDYNFQEAKALKIAQLIGADTIFKTTFEAEATSDLVGERSVLMGGIKAFFSAQYNCLRSHGHSPLEAYYETVYEALNSLYPMINDKGMSWMFQNCSTTAQRGAIDWSSEYEKVIIPVLEKCYKNVEMGDEAKHVINCNSDKNYRIKLNEELKLIDNEEIEQVGKFVRSLKNL